MLWAIICPVVLLTSPALAQGNPGLPVHAMADGLFLTIGTAALASSVYVVRVTARSPAGDTVGARPLTVLH